MDAVFEFGGTPGFLAGPARVGLVHFTTAVALLSYGRLAARCPWQHLRSCVFFAALKRVVPDILSYMIQQSLFTVVRNQEHAHNNTIIHTLRIIR